MFDIMAVPVLAPADAAGIIVRHHAGPHDVCPRFIVIRIGDYARPFMDHGQQQGFNQPVCNFNLGGVGQIPFIEMSHDVRDPGRGLERRERLGQSGVQNREFRTDGVSGGAALEHPVLQGNDTVRTAFAAGGRNRQHRADGERFFNIFSAVEIPKIAVIDRSGGNGFGRVDGAAAAHGQNKIDLFFPAQFDSFIDQAAAGIGFHAAETERDKAFRFQGSFHPVDQPGTEGAAPAEVNQDPAAAEAFNQSSGLIFRIFTENKAGGGIKSKVVHDKSSFVIEKSRAIRRNVQPHRVFFWAAGQVPHRLFRPRSRT